MRIPLPTTLLTRISDMDRDRRNINGVYEKGDVIKRPGVVTTSYNYDNHQGVVGMQGYLITVYDDTLDVFDYVPVTPTINIGDLVSGYYAMVKNPSTSPGPGDPYWSATPPGTDRWRGFWYGSAGGGAAATYPESPNYLIGDEAASDAAAAKVWVEKVIGANLAGIAVLDGDNTYSPDVVSATFTFNSFPTHTYAGNIEMSVNGKNALLSSPYPGGWPSGVSWTGPTTYSDYVGQVRKRRSTASFTLTSTGTSAKIVSAALFGAYQHIEIAGCDQAEYNGLFYAKTTLDPTYPWLTPAEWFFTLSGAPAASPATGSSKILYYYY